MLDNFLSVEIYYSDDYASLDLGNTSFYYGYESECPKTGLWCFEVTVDKKKEFIITSKIIDVTVSHQSILSSPRDYLLAGIGIYLKTNQLI